MKLRINVVAALLALLYTADNSILAKVVGETTVSPTSTTPTSTPTSLPTTTSPVTSTPSSSSSPTTSTPTTSSGPTPSTSTPTSANAPTAAPTTAVPGAPTASPTPAKTEAPVSAPTPAVNVPTFPGLNNNNISSTLTPSPTTTANDSSSGGSNTVLIVSCVAGGIAVVVIIGVAMVMVKKNSENRDSYIDNTPDLLKVGKNSTPNFDVEEGRRYGQAPTGMPCAVCGKISDNVHRSGGLCVRCETSQQRSADMMASGEAGYLPPNPQAVNPYISGNMSGGMQQNNYMRQGPGNPNFVSGAPVSRPAYGQPVTQSFAMQQHPQESERSFTADSDRPRMSHAESEMEF